MDENQDQQQPSKTRPIASAGHGPSVGTRREADVGPGDGPRPGDAAPLGTGARAGDRRAPAVAAGTDPALRPGAGVEPDARSDSALVLIKGGVTAVRSVRDGLVQLVHWLSDEPGVVGYLLLPDSRLSRTLLAKELIGLRAAMRPEVAGRLHLVLARGGQLERGGPLGYHEQAIPEHDRALLARCLAAMADPKTVLPNPRKREEVLWVLLERWFRAAGPVKTRRLEAMVGCNYRTVAAVVKRLRMALAKHSDRQIELARFPEAAWKESLALQDKARATRRFALATDAPRPSEEWIAALKTLGRPDVAVGGALGALRHHPGLRCPAAPRLDLCVHAPRKSVDLDFVAQLDPALRQLDAPHQPAHLALRFVRRRESPFTIGEDGIPQADPIECLLGLYDACLPSTAEEFESHLRERRGDFMPDRMLWDPEPFET